MKCHFLRAAGYTRMDKKRNKDIYEELNTVPIVDLS